MKEYFAISLANGNVEFTDLNFQTLFTVQGKVPGKHFVLNVTNIMKTDREGDFLIITDGINMNVNSWIKPAAFAKQQPHSYKQDGYGRGGHIDRGGYMNDRGGYRGGKTGGFNKRGGF